MPHVIQTLSAGSPLIDLYVGVSSHRRAALIKANQKVPDFQVARALIDTGASSTCIDPATLRPLGLTPTGTISIHTPTTAGNAHQCEQYDVSLGIYHPKNSMVLATLPVIAADLAPQGIHALVGRDVLSSCLLVYDGTNGLFTIAF